MKELLKTFLKKQDRGSFMALRSEVMSADGFDPYSMELHRIDELMEKGDFEMAIEELSKILSPSYFLSPRAHMSLAFAKAHTGKREEAAAEMRLGNSLLHGIELTGDGSQQAPFFVSRTNDEYDYLSAHALTFAGQKLVVEGDRKFDRMATEEGQDIWFDITEIAEISSRNFDKLGRV